MKRLPVLLQGTVTVAVLLLVARRVDVGAAMTAASHASPVWLALALAMNVLAVCASTGLWATLIPRRTSSYARLWRIYVTGLFYNNLGLGTVVGDGFRYTRLLRAGEHSGGAAVSVLGERLISGAALLTLAALGSLYFAGSRPILPIAVWAGIALAVSACAASMRFARVLLRRLSVTSAVKAYLARVDQAVDDLRAQPSVVAVGFGWACVVQSSTVMATFFLVHALGIDMSLSACFAVVPLIALGVLMPISVQGIGVREATYVMLFRLVGLTSSQALSCAMLSYLTTLAVTGVGGIFALADLRTNTALTPAPTVEPANLHL